MKNLTKKDIIVAALGVSLCIWILLSFIEVNIHSMTGHGYSFWNFFIILESIGGTK